MFALAACGEVIAREDRVALAREVAPTVKSFQATGKYVDAGGEPAVTIEPLAGPGDGAVQVLPGAQWAARPSGSAPALRFASSRTATAAESCCP